VAWAVAAWAAAVWAAAVGWVAAWVVQEWADQAEHLRVVNLARSLNHIQHT